MQKQRVKTSMSVPEMGKMLGLGKVESYWLVKKNYFKTIQVAGRMRVMLDSFEDWYAGQFHYKKVDGTPPGEKWRHTTMSVPEMADLLGLKSGTAYDLVKCVLQGKYAGRVTDVRHGVVFIRLNNGVNAVAHTCYDRRMPGKKDDVSFAVTRLDEERGIAVGIITRIIKQNL